MEWSEKLVISAYVMKLRMFKQLWGKKIVSGRDTMTGAWYAYETARPPTEASVAETALDVLTWVEDKSTQLNDAAPVLDNRLAAQQTMMPGLMKHCTPLRHQLVLNHFLHFREKLRIHQVLYEQKNRLLILQKSNSIESVVGENTLSALRKSTALLTWLVKQKWVWKTTLEIMKLSVWYHFNEKRTIKIRSQWVIWIDLIHEREKSWKKFKSYRLKCVTFMKLNNLKLRSRVRFLKNLKGKQLQQTVA